MDFPSPGTVVSKGRRPRRTSFGQQESESEVTPAKSKTSGVFPPSAPRSERTKTAQSQRVTAPKSQKRLPVEEVKAAEEAEAAQAEQFYSPQPNKMPRTAQPPPEQVPVPEAEAPVLEEEEEPRVQPASPRSLPPRSPLPRSPPKAPFTKIPSPESYAFARPQSPVKIPGPRSPPRQPASVPQAEAAAAAPAQAPAAAALPQQDEEEKMVRHLAASINNILVRTLPIMLDALGAVSAKLGDWDVRHSLVWIPRGSKEVRDDPLEYLRIIDEGDPELKTMKYFLGKYGHVLGYRFLQAYLEPWMKNQKAEANAAAEKLRSGISLVPELAKNQLIGHGCFDFEDDLNNPNAFGMGARLLADKETLSLFRNSLQATTDLNSAEGKAIARYVIMQKMSKDAVDLLGLTKPEQLFAPAWAFEVISSDVFRAFVQPARLAAFELAHAQVIRIPGCESFTIKELICSKGVVDQFAWMVAYQYMDASKGLPTRRIKGEKIEHGIYVNINHMRETIQKRAFLCRIWFESVRAFPNPILHKYKAYVDEQREFQRKLGHLDTDEKVALFEEAMAMYGEMMPKRELKYMGN